MIEFLNGWRLGRYPLFILCCSLSFLACQNQSTEQSESVESGDAESEDEFFLSEVLTDRKDSTLLRWSHFYQTQDSIFELSAFVPEDSVHVSPMKGTVKAISDPAFHAVYTPFLIFSPDSSRYIDIDSYLWTLDAYGDPSFEADQEINLIDMKTDSVTRVGFLGPSLRIEEVIWLDDTNLVLLGNQDGDRPFIQKLNLETFAGRKYLYPRRIHRDGDYIERRIRHHLRK